MRKQNQQGRVIGRKYHASQRWQHIQDEGTSSSNGPINLKIGSYQNRGGRLFGRGGYQGRGRGFLGKCFKWN